MGQICHNGSASLLHVERVHSDRPVSSSWLQLTGSRPQETVHEGLAGIEPARRADNRLVYEAKIVDNAGRRREITLDAKTLEPLSED